MHAIFHSAKCTARKRPPSAVLLDALTQLLDDVLLLFPACHYLELKRFSVQEVVQLQE